MAEIQIKSGQISKIDEKGPVSQYLIGFYEKNIPWWPFIIVSILIAVIIGITTSVNVGFSPIYIPIGIIGIFIALIVFQRPEIGCYILILSTFSSISDILTDKGLPAINRPLIALALGSVFINYFMKTGRYNNFPKSGKPQLALLSYYTVIVLSVIILPDLSSAFSIIFDITKDILVGVSVFITLNTQERWKSGLMVLITTVIILAALGVVKTASGTEATFFDLARNSDFGQLGEENELRYGGPIGEPNLWGQVLVSTLPFIIYKIFENRSFKDKGLLTLGGLLILLAMVYTSSRGAIVAFILIIPLIAIDMKIKPAYVVGIGLLLIAFFSILPKTYQERFGALNIFSNQSNLAQDESVEGRRTTMLIGLEMFRANPLLGVGFGNYRNNYWQYAEQIGLESNATNITNYTENAQYAHSLYIEILSETGLLGILTFALFLGVLLTNLYQLRNKFKDIPLHREWSLLLIALGMSIFTFLVSGIFLHGVFFRFIWVLIGLAMSAISISEELKIIPFARQIRSVKNIKK